MTKRVQPLLARRPAAVSLDPEPRAVDINAEAERVAAEHVAWASTQPGATPQQAGKALGLRYLTTWRQVHLAAVKWWVER